MNEIAVKTKPDYKKILFKVSGIIIAVYWVLFSLCAIFTLVDKYYLYPIKYEKEINFYADFYKLDRGYVYSVINTESKFNKDAKSNKGALGLMQITPQTADYIASMKGVEVYNLYDTSTNIEFGCYYLRYLFDKFSNYTTVTCAYNAGEGNVILWLRNKEYSENGITITKIPFPETKEYVTKVKKSFKKYKKLYPYIVDKTVEFE